MEGSQKSKHSRYDHARQAFNELGLDDRVLFLFRESLNTAADAFEKASEMVRADCARIFNTNTDKADSAPKPESGDI